MSTHVKSNVKTLFNHHFSLNSWVLPNFEPQKSWLGAGDGAEGSPASGRDLGTAGRRRPLAADQGVGGGRLAAPGAERRGKWITLW